MMKIDIFTLERLIWIIYQRYFDYQKIVLKDVKIETDENISIDLLLYYYHVETKVSVQAKISVGQDIVIKTSGDIQYGFIHFDLHRLLAEYLPKHPDIQVKNDLIIIKNEYLKDIRIDQEYIELELL